MSDCIFCKIINNEIPSYTVYEDAGYKVILDRFPSSVGHMLIIPKKHIEDIFSLDEETAAGLFQLAAMLAPRLKKALQAEGLNILQNNGEAAGQTVQHLHVHLIPRYKNDKVNIKWKESDPTPEEFEKTLTEINNI